MKLAQFNEDGKLVCMCEFECHVAPSPYICVDHIDYAFNAIDENGVPVWVEPPFFLENYKFEALVLIKKRHECTVAHMHGKYSSAEKNSFPQKQKEALAWKINRYAKTPYIDAMSGNNPLLKESIIKRILDNIEEVAKLEMHVVGLRDSIKLATSKEEIDSLLDSSLLMVFLDASESRMGSQTGILYPYQPSSET